MTPKLKIIVAALAIAGVGAAVWFAAGGGKPDAQAKAPAGGAQTETSTAKPALVVVPVRAESREMALGLSANGSVAAWQEASIGAEVNGLRLKEVRVNVGDRVKRGQVLAEFAGETPVAEVAQGRAALAEADAALQDARSNAARARAVEPTGALSAQQIAQYLTAETTAQARLEAARANLSVIELRLRHTRVTASDEGVISWRGPAATVGAVVPQGQELFRLIRQNRLEWRAEVSAADIGRISAGQAVTVTPAGGTPVAAKVRIAAPTVDPATRNAIVYVDLPASATTGPNPPFKAGMFARGDFALGTGKAIALPRQAVVVRDGFSYVFRIGADNRVAQVKVRAGRRVDNQVEILEGLDEGAAVVGDGAGFLNDGDLIKVSATAPAQKADAGAAAVSTAATK